MIVGIFDIESTGLLEDPESTITEFGGVKWDTVNDRFFDINGFLVDSLDDKQQVPEFITGLTGITTEMLKSLGRSPEYFIHHFKEFQQSCDVLMARNGVAFDVPMVSRFFASFKHTLEPVVCIDDYLDVTYPEHVKGRTQSHIASDLGFLNPFPHQSITDALTLGRIFQICKFDMVEAGMNARTPLVEVQAMVSFQEKDLAKQMKFNWEPERKVWVKNYRKRVFEKTEFPFETEAVEHSLTAILNNM